MTESDQRAFFVMRNGRVFIMKKYKCSVCGYIYDPAAGDPDNGIEAGTSFEDLP